MNHFQVLTSFMLLLLNPLHTEPLNIFVNTTMTTTLDLVGQVVYDSSQHPDRWSSSQVLRSKTNYKSPCGKNITAFKGNVGCFDTITRIFVGHCMSYIYPNMSNITDFEGYVLARCPFYAGTDTLSLFIAMNYTPTSEFNDIFCGSLSHDHQTHRNGQLCSLCTEGYGINIFSPSYECKDCTASDTSQAVKYLSAFGTSIIPVTILFLIVTIFHIGLTSAPTNGYLFFSHVITIQLNVLVIETAWSTQLSTSMHNSTEAAAKTLTRLLLIPHYIWTFDFPYIFNADVSCLDKSISIMHIISMQYIYALYPMLLVLLSFLLIKLHGRNCKPVVFLWKPFCFLCVRLRRNWEVKTSLIDAFATFILLSYRKLIEVSLALINPNPVYSADGTVVYTTLHYDVSVVYLSSQHLPFFIIAIIILLLGLFPPLLLIFYPFRWFQRILNLLQLNRLQCLYTFVDAFQGCYKSGTNGSPERRYFAGFYFVFRIIILGIQSITYMTLQTMNVFLIGVYIFFLLTVAVLQPYKNNFFNCLDAFFFAILAMSSGNMLYVLGFAQVHTTLPTGVWPTTYILLLLPATYMVCYIFYWVLTRFRARCYRRHIFRLKFFKSIERHDDSDLQGVPNESGRSSSSPTHTYLESFSDDHDMPDRLANPYRYGESHQYRSRLFANHSSLLGSETSDSRAKRAEPKYGSITY